MPREFRRRSLTEDGRRRCPSYPDRLWLERRPLTPLPAGLGAQPSGEDPPRLLSTEREVAVGLLAEADCEAPRAGNPPAHTEKRTALAHPLPQARQARGAEAARSPVK